MGRLSFRMFLAGQWEPVPPVETQDLAGKTVLVVGANAGIGFEAAKHFASMGPALLVLACRSAKKGEEAARAIRAATGFDGTAVRTVDLAVFASVVAFASDFEKEFGRLDIYVYNAGISASGYEQTTDGWETTLQVNDLSCVLLSVLLVPAMLRAAEPKSRPRAVIVASEVHFWRDITSDELASPRLLEKFNDKAYCTPTVMKDRYMLSKLLNVFFVREFAARLPADSPLITTVVNPGFCKTDLGRNFTFPASVSHRIFQFLVARTAEEGARALVWAALGARNREQELRGAYVSDASVRETSDFVLSDEGRQAQRRIWDESVEILSAVSPAFKEVLDKHVSQ